jgi:hypothetical protein
METQSEKMVRKILTLYRQACRQGRADVAEHLLCALETPDDWNLPQHVGGSIPGTYAAQSALGG